jgi:hypothetical protein
MKPRGGSAHVTIRLRKDQLTRRRRAVVKVVRRSGFGLVLLFFAGSRARLGVPIVASSRDVRRRRDGRWGLLR